MKGETFVSNAKDRQRPLEGEIADEWFREYSPERHANPYDFYRRLRQEQPVYFLERRNVWIATRYQDVYEVLKSGVFIREAHRLLPPEQMVPPPPQYKPLHDLTHHWMLFRDPPAHTRLRALVSKAFTPRMLESTRPRIRAIAEDLIGRFQARGKIDLMPSYAFPLPVMVIAEILGVPGDDRDRFKEWSNTIARLLDIAVQPPDFQQHAVQVAIAMSEYFRDLIAQRRKRPQRDLISSLLSAQEQGERLSDDELVSTCVLLLVAGHETTVNLIGNGMFTLLQHPDQLQTLKENPELAGLAVEEILRYESPVQMTSRFAAEDVELGGRLIRRGQEVVVVLAAANRDPEQFTDPDRFDIARTPNRHLAFATGAHFCLGAPLARMEGEIALSLLLRTFPDLRLGPDTPKWRPNILFRGLESLHVVLN